MTWSIFFLSITFATASVRWWIWRFTILQKKNKTAHASKNHGKIALVFVPLKNVAVSDGHQTLCLPKVTTCKPTRPSLQNKWFHYNATILTSAIDIRNSNISQSVIIYEEHFALRRSSQSLYSQQQWKHYLRWPYSIYVLAADRANPLCNFPCQGQLRAYKNDLHIFYDFFFLLLSSSAYSSCTTRSSLTSPELPVDNHWTGQMLLSLEMSSKRISWHYLWPRTSWLH